ncbi:hypothetical protein BOO71_0009010 [Deinococcus marmoris]|uniref:Uncharacterized protein n=1 Tax=Deinococcus marmoris TaxID=249408 RepID=A0A1U7NWX2_9DEIO|nr:hypothetical protein BOO71_0009010 [Deinococcus marmoris]
MRHPGIRVEGWLPLAFQTVFPGRLFSEDSRQYTRRGLTRS